MTIYEIKRRVLASNPDDHFFDRSTMRFFGQTLKSFSVTKAATPDAWVLRAPARNIYGKPMDETVRLFDGNTNTLKTIK